LNYFETAVVLVEACKTDEIRKFTIHLIQSLPLFVTAFNSSVTHQNSLSIFIKRLSVDHILSEIAVVVNSEQWIKIVKLLLNMSTQISSVLITDSTQSIEIMNNNVYLLSSAVVVCTKSTQYD
jgi:hypothetical protein